MNKKYMLGTDPSGAFMEGKGTTGMCLIVKTNKYKIQWVGDICAKDFATPEAYWNEHLRRIEFYHTRYKDLIVSMEDYILYENRAMSQANSHMETSQLIGCIRLYCWQNNIELHMRNAVQVKKRWSDEILVHKGLLQKINNKYYCTARQDPLSLHIRDSIRHAIHCAAFELHPNNYNKGGNINEKRRVSRSKNK